jgi:dephospho-CoA kinase
MILLGIHGRARTGKTTSQQYLESLNQGIYCTSMAKRVYQTVQVLFNLTDEELTDKYKTIKHPIWGLNLREMLILVGHDMARKIYRDDIWMTHMDQEIQSLKHNSWVKAYVITDIRYQDERDWLLSNGGILVHILRPTDQINHITEQGLEVDSDKDFVIDNCGDLSKLHNQWNWILERLEIY